MKAFILERRIQLVLIGVMSAAGVLLGFLWVQHEHSAKTHYGPVVVRAIDALSRLKSNYTSGSADAGSPAIREHVVKSFAIAIDKLRADPDVSHSWPVLAMLLPGDGSEGTLGLTWVGLGTETVGVVISDESRTLGRFRVISYAGADKKWLAGCALRANSVAVHLTDNELAADQGAELAGVTLPRSCLSRRLHLQLLRIDGTVSPAIEVCSVRVSGATSQPGPQIQMGHPQGK